LELLDTAIKGVIKENSEVRKYLESIHRRARNIIDKRHSMMHDSWGTNRDGSVVRMSIRGNSDRTPVSLKELEKIISDIRNLIEEVRFHITKLDRDAATLKDKE
jgi:hypothetical protein